ncbi:MAG: glutaredoxin family protein [Thiobacillus sp.]|nr:glutaredoxin family protein [Thiobacillus sp.]
MSKRLTLYTRAGCPLCEEMAAAVEGLLDGRAVGITLRDVDADATLKARFGWDVPLLFDGEIEICRHRIDENAFRAWLAENA